MFAKNNDPKLLWFAAGVFVIGAIASALGIARFTIATSVAAATESGFATIIATLGSLGWYFALMYGFSQPGRRRLLTTLGPGLIVAALYHLVAVRPYYPQTEQVWIFFGLLGCALGYPSLLKMAYDRYLGGATDGYRNKLDAMLFTSIGILILAFTPPAYIDIATSLHPNTYDALLYHFESTFGFQPSVVLGLWADASPWFSAVLQIAYNGLPLTFGILVGAQLARPGRPSVNLLAVWIVSTVIAMVGFHLLPVAGPRYLFDGFPALPPPLDLVPLAPIQLPPSPRNGVPSLHFGWALLLWLNSSLLGSRWLRGFFTLAMGLNFLATMALGEHYLIDLVLAIPMVVAVQALCMNTLPRNDPLRNRAAAGGIALWLAWVIALRFGVPVFQAVPGMSWIAVILTIGASAWLYRPLVRGFVSDWYVANENTSASAAPAATPVVAPEVRIVALMFVLSGFAGLMYEVLFSKALALTFGSTATAMYTVLATYMGGMAIGAWLGGRLAAGRSNPLALYALCEVTIGIYCAATLLIFKGIQDVYVQFAAGLAPDAPILTVLRVGLGVVALTLPTVLMGMTLPVLARFLEQRSYPLGRSVAVLYACNTIGAALGALFAGYLVIPQLGIGGTTFAAVLLSLVVALLALRLHKRTGGHATGRVQVTEPAALHGDPAMRSLAVRTTRRLGAAALASLGIGGIVTLAIETNYIHLLAIVAGNSTYAFSLMLFTFLFGLGIGAEVARRLLDGNRPLGLLLAWFEFGLAIVILGGVFLWDEMPEYFASFAGYPLARGFAAREVVRGIVCWLAMFPPAVFIGAIYPIAMECIGRANPGQAIQALGRAAALNTLGNIAGVLVGGFVLLPVIGALRTVQLLASVCIALGVMVLALSPAARRWSGWAPAALAIAVLAIQPGSFNYDNLASGANVYFGIQNSGKIIDHSESIDGGLTSVAQSAQPGLPPVRTLLTNGKFQGNDAQGGEMQAQIGFSLAPLLHTNRRESALVIGFGTGVSSRVLHQAGFAQLDVVDLSADIIRMANRHFASVNADVTRQPGVKTYVTDGRNYLLLQDRKYDLVGIEISSIWFAGAASLYNREFYSLVRQRLYPEGVLQQWVQLHHIGHEDVLRVLGSVRAEFRHVWLYVIGGQGIIVASNDPRALPKPENLELLRQTGTLGAILRILDRDPAELLNAHVLDPAGTDRLLANFGVPATYWVSTDDNLFLEYSTPKGNVLGASNSVSENVQFIKEHSRKAR